MSPVEIGIVAAVFLWQVSRELKIRRLERELEAVRKELEAIRKERDWLKATETEEDRRQRALLVRGIFASAVMQSLAIFRPRPQ